MKRGDQKDSSHHLRAFLTAARNTQFTAKRSLSLFSGAGLSDCGYEAAGFYFSVHNELSEGRLKLGASNFSDSKWIAGDVRDKAAEIIDAFKQSSSARPELLVATPPCQGMSSSNPTRGKRELGVADEVQRKNELLLAIVPIVRQLVPRMIVCENVRQILTLPVKRDTAHRRAVDLLKDDLPEYVFFEGVLNVADYGIPQDRRRAVIVGIQQDEPCLCLLQSWQRSPWPRQTHSSNGADGTRPWVTLREWFEAMQYEELDALAKPKGVNQLHCVPAYIGDRYLMLSSVPAYSGKNAYENQMCIECGASAVPLDTAYCTECGGAMRTRPLVWEDGTARLIKGFDSSYRRMHPDYPAPTVTTNSSHIGSDFKIHPWQHRVLSTLECSDLQTVPRWYEWETLISDGQRYAIRQVIGEAFPPYFTYRHGIVLRDLLSGRCSPEGLAPLAAVGLGHRKTKPKREMIAR